MEASKLDIAIFQTLIYGSIFNFPMTAHEIHRYLIGEDCTLKALCAKLNAPSQWLAERIQESSTDLRLYAPATCDPAIFENRRAREAASAQLWPKAMRWATWLGRLPFVRMVAMTGALSVRNASSPDDDLDYMLVVREGRVWLSRLLAVVLVRVARRWDVEICPNYVLSEAALHQERHDLFIAHELTQMVPLVGHDVYTAMRQQNPWVFPLLPNATGAPTQEEDRRPRRIGALLKNVAEMALGGWLGDRLERWEMRRKLQKFQGQLQNSADVELDETRVKGHFMDYGTLTLQRYHDALVAAGLGQTARQGAEAAD